MIEWKPIDTHYPPEGIYVLASGGRMFEKSRFYRGTWRDWGHRTQPTHWAPINLPGEPASCETCGKQQTCPWTNTGNGPCNGWSKCV